jgi:hypothetical protein
MEATCSSETSVYFRRNTRRYILEDRTLQCLKCLYVKNNRCSATCRIMDFKLFRLTANLQKRIRQGCKAIPVTGSGGP